MTGKEVDARFEAGDTEGALDLIHLLWDQMTVKSGRYYTGGVWEKLNQRRNGRRRQREPFARLGERSDVESEWIRARRTAQDRGLRQMDRRAAARR